MDHRLAEDGPRVRDVGEGGLLARLRPLLAAQTAGLPLAWGDDVAVTAERAGRLAWTIDTMVEGTHFRWWRENPPELVGRKLAATNLSDLASKGARPWVALLSLGVPADAPAAAAEAVVRGVALRLAEAGGALIGGDTVRAPQWCLTLALAGALDPAAPVAARGNARPGMAVYVTGNPGESAAGLEILEMPRNGDRAIYPPLVRAHLDPEPRLAEGALLARLAPDLAMIDVSDGVAHECLEIARHSGVRVVLDSALLPVSLALGAYAQAAGRDALDLLLHGGEDYELLFCTAVEEGVLQSAFRDAGIRTPLTRIGRVEEGSGAAIVTASGAVLPLHAEGFEHFGG
jgi:thiamine-monophosphate kinase